MSISVTQINDGYAVRKMLVRKELIRRLLRRRLRERSGYGRREHDALSTLIL